MTHIKSNKQVSTSEFRERRKDLQQCIDHLEALDERFNAFRFTYKDTFDLSVTRTAKKMIIELRNELEMFK
jgi:hypothetical protein